MQYLSAMVVGLLFAARLFLPVSENSQSDARLVKRYERSCGYSCAQELAIDLGGVYAKGNHDIVAVRFCSKESLPLALATAAAPPKDVLSILMSSYGFVPERILFLRSENCLGANPAVTPTEFWVIPKGAALPTSVESIKSNQVQVHPLGMEGLIGNARSYKEGMRQLPDKLRANPEGVGLVLGYYYKRPSNRLKQRLDEARRMLQRSGLSKNRYSVRFVPWTGEYGDDDQEPTYPSLFVIEVTKDLSVQRKPAARP
jgi:hypothetical protein